MRGVLSATNSLFTDITRGRPGLTKAGRRTRSAYPALSQILNHQFGIAIH
jgi:hypothetical protein